MKKTDAISKLGGTADAARAIGISYQAVDKWPDNLTPRIKDRVQAAFVRRYPSDWAARWPELANLENSDE